MNTMRACAVFLGVCLCSAAAVAQTADTDEMAAAAAQTADTDEMAAVPAQAAASRDLSQIGRGPTSISNELELVNVEEDGGDSAHPVLDRWYGFKERLKEQHNFEFGIAYSAIYQRASDTLVGGSRGVRLLSNIYDYLQLSPVPAVPVQDAGGGIVEFQGVWTLIHPNTPNKGFIAFDLEHRHRIASEIPPANLFLDAGSFWPSNAAYSEFDPSLLSLYYEQYLADGRIGFRIGKTIPFAIYDYFSLKNPKRDFSDGSLTLNPAIAWPTWGFGITLLVKPTEQTYILSGIHDLNGGPDRGVESFFELREYFKAVEIGWDTKFSFGDGNAHIFYWHADRRKRQNLPTSQGITVAGEQSIGRWLPFLRYSYSDGGAAALRHLVVGGLGIKEVFGRKDDVLGIGFGWGEPILNELFVDQKSLEVFYRMQFTKEFSLSGAVQYIKDPPLNLVTDDLTIFSVRGRTQF